MKTKYSIGEVVEKVEQALANREYSNHHNDRFNENHSLAEWGQIIAAELKQEQEMDEIVERHRKAQEAVA